MYQKKMPMLILASAKLLFFFEKFLLFSKNQTVFSIKAFFKFLFASFTLMVMSPFCFLLCTMTTYLPLKSMTLLNIFLICFLLFLGLLVSTFIHNLQKYEKKMILSK